VRPECINRICCKLSIQRSDIEIDLSQPEGLPPELPAPKGWRIEQILGGWVTCDNGLQFRLAKLCHTENSSDLARGKYYDLLHVAPDRRNELHEHLRRHADVCARIDPKAGGIAINRDFVKLGSGEAYWVIDHWVRGDTLEEFKARAEEMPFPTVQKIGARILEGLATLHRAGVVMRELTPSRVYVDHETVTITDYEMAKLIDGKISVSGLWDMPNPYRAPEVVDRNPRIQSDIFSWAMIMCFLLAGSPLTQPDAIASLHSNVATRKLLTSCLHRSFGKRPGSAAETLALWNC
jgi:serine/threonine protein kinase